MVQQGDLPTDPQGADPSSHQDQQWEAAEDYSEQRYLSDFCDMLAPEVDEEREEKESEDNEIPSSPSGSKPAPSASVPQDVEASSPPPLPAATTFDTMGMLTNMAEANVRSTRGD